MGDIGGSGRVVQPAAVEGRSMAVLYGSETGASEDIAGELGKTAQRLHYQTTVDEMDNFKLVRHPSKIMQSLLHKHRSNKKKTRHKQADLLRSSLVVFVTSTTGQGDMPKNTLKFWKNLRREKLNNTNCLRSLRFAIFGLGDSSYPKFNWAARKLRARLLQLGATEFFRPGEGDERHDNGIDSIYLPWYEELKKTLLADYPLPESLKPIPDDVQLPPKYPIELLSIMSDTDHHGSVDGPSLTKDELLFLASKTKSADRSHVDNPLTTAEKAREDWLRRNLAFPVDSIRRDGVFERSDPRAFAAMDKSNRLKDHPEKYLLQRQLTNLPASPPEYLAPTNLPASPPEYLLPIPDTYVGTLLSHNRVTPSDHWQDVRHLAFDIDVGERAFPDILQFSGSLTLTIWPKNYPQNVDELILQMGWGAEADAPLQLKGVPPGLYSQDRVTTLRHLLTHNLDITAVPKRSFIRGLLYFTNDERERERLQELVEPGNEQEFYDYTCRPRRTILELLRDFTGIKIPYNRVLDMFPVIRGREFSVCNGGDSITAADERCHVRIEILVALVEYKTIIRKPRQGLCSHYFRHLPVGTRLTVRLAPSSSHLVRGDVEARRPLIAIATGTGVAPIRAVIQERDCYADVGDTILFFGSRNRSADFHFADEWRLHANLRVFPAFSRDGIEPDPKATVTTIIPPPAYPLATALETVYPNQYDAHKNYVQHLIRAHAAEVGALMRRRPYVLICGSNGRMPVSVRNALLDALVIDKVCETKEAAGRWLSNPRNVTMWQETW
ncbi:hypothetical protein F5144DRAFT_237835 [Chaetomium tenue]|uniref:Uncharacterized protein n=1 Tax=Chaetomium tenue TaxID=1854479 RepID=A0ACB7P7C9_9PEZI|nr:hypothetical protein F5144DRAFT_237835 [Chaetomium globosum]